MDDGVLVLNNNYQPLNITSVQRAIVMLYLGRAHAIETDSRTYHSEKLTMIAPTVVRLHNQVRRPMPVLQISRKSIFARDSHMCQYCGAKHVPLTLDHVTPKDLGGKTEWNNLVCCCTHCNNRKANRRPHQAGMTLRKVPRRPKFIPYISYTKFVAAARNPAWRPYLEPYGEIPED